MVSRRYELTDEQWNKIKQYFDSKRDRPYKNVRKVHDITVAASFLANLKANIVMADAAYDSDKFREQIAFQGASACIKPRRNRKIAIPFDKEQYKERHIVEFQTLSQNCYSLRYQAFSCIYLPCLHLIWLL